MARRTKDAPARSSSGRVTPKGTAPRGTSTHPRREAGAPTTSGRYTAPMPDELRSSPWWVPAIMLAFFALGVLAIVLNYLSLLPDSPSNWYLLGGLGGIILGFVSATQYH